MWRMGLSQTIFVGEVPWQASAGWALGTRARPSAIRDTRSTASPPSQFRCSGLLPPFARNANPMELDQKIELNELKVAQTFVGGFGSSHPGDGANFGFGDGSVRFLKQTLDPTVFRRLGHRCDGETIDDEAY